MKATDLLTGRELETVRVRRLGGGAQADVFLVRIVGRPGPWIVKRLRTTGHRDPHAQHLIALVHHVTTRADPGVAAGLVGLPAAVVAPHSGGIAAVGRYVEGTALSEPGAHGLVGDSLRARLKVAASLAEQQQLMHDACIVWADWAEANTIIVITPGRPPAAVAIDVDGGGVHDGTGRYYPGLRPVVRWRLEGSVTPPENYLDGTLAPSSSGDLWALSVGLFGLLYFGADPFGLEPSYLAVANARVNWRPMDVRPGRPGSGVIAGITGSLGREIETLFGRVFTPVGGSWVASLRPAAAEWRAALNRAASWVVACGDHEYVALQRDACPFDRTPAPHARLVAGGLMRAIDRDGVVLTAEGLGMSGARGPVVRFSRDDEALLVQALAPVSLDRVFGRSDRLYLDPRQWSVARLRPGRYTMRIWRPGGWGRPAEVALEEPLR
jgi:hypothetical protein